ncbi:MAG TPA: GPW/gp25 family protein [Streptosporangiaceae bacterium]|nr:GPW/gp25 family protein [Streptosporangiaceae bacterium]
MNDQVYGNGLAYPLQLGAQGLGQAAGRAKTEQSIRIILGTQYGERVMRPRFGGNLKSLVFAPNNASTANLARYYVTDALTQWEPRIDVLGVTVTNDNLAQALLIDIQYQMRATGDVHNLVYVLNLEGSP